MWMLIDVVLVFAGTILGDDLFVWWGQSGGVLGTYHPWLPDAILAISVIFAGSIIGLYENTTLWARSRIVARCLLTACLAVLAAWIVMHLLMYSMMSRRSIACGIVLFLVAASIVRLVAHHAVRDVRRGLLVIGQGPLTGSIIRSVRRGSVPGYNLVGVVSADAGGRVEQGHGDIPVVGDIAELQQLCRTHNVAEVVVAETAAKDPRQQKAALSCLRLGCRVTDETTFYESTYGEVPVSHITPNWFLAADLTAHLQEYAVVKRIFDFLVASALMILGLPIAALIAICLWIEGKGPVFYSQTRVGCGGRPFTLYKFRTMCDDAEAGGSTWASENDPRVTKLGFLLRRLRLDELPQLWNILKGDMTIVGPRPERPEFVEPLGMLIPFYDERHLVKPGLTGWAQIHYPYGATIADARRKLQLDLYYIKRACLELDLIILLRTLGTFFLGSR
jgi:exopolysaccharide biosynthesis polyprenyl glycosylphosphotransferase